MEVSGKFSQFLDPKNDFFVCFERNRVESDNFEELVQHPSGYTVHG